MSYATFARAGSTPSTSSSRRSGGSPEGETGGSSSALFGRYESTRRTSAMQSSSLSAKRSTCPVVFAWSSQPPISSLVTVSPVAAASTGGPETAMMAPFTWMTTSATDAFHVGPP